MHKVYKLLCSNRTRIQNLGKIRQCNMWLKTQHLLCQQQTPCFPCPLQSHGSNKQVFYSFFFCGFLLDFIPTPTPILHVCGSWSYKMLLNTTNQDHIQWDISSLGRNETWKGEGLAARSHPTQDIEPHFLGRLFVHLLTQDLSISFVVPFKYLHLSKFKISAKK